MGQDTAEIKDEDNLELDNQEQEDGITIEGETDGTPELEGDEDSEGDGQEESDEVELVIEGSQPTEEEDKGNPFAIRQRINKLKGKEAEAKQETSDAMKRISDLEEENKVYKLAIDQRGVAPVPLKQPDLDEFLGDTSDPEYIKQTNEYNQNLINEGITNGIAEANKQAAIKATQQDQSAQNEKLHIAHFERAAKLKVKDYNESEDKLIDELGLQFVRGLIEVSEKSELLIYYFSKNPEKGHALKSLFSSNNGLAKGLKEVGRLEEVIKSKPKRSQAAPDPDDELVGGGGGKTNAKDPWLKGAKFE